MSQFGRLVLGALALLCGTLATPSLASAQGWLNKPLRLVVAYPPGGPTDVVARLYATKITEMWKHPVVVENRPGANGNIAAQVVQKAAPDGSTLLLHSSSLVINSLLYKNIGYDPLADFTPISQVFDYKLVVVVHPSTSIHSLKDLVAEAKAKPGTITFASAGGVGAPTQLAVEMFKQIAGIDMVHVPYTGGAPATNDLVAGHVNLMFNNPTQALPFVKTGQLRGLAVTGPERMKQAPELPTVAELGYPGFDVGTWFGLWGPAGLPKEIVDGTSAAVIQISRLPDVVDQLFVQGLNVIGGTPAELAAVMRHDLETWGKVIRTAGISME